LGFEYWILTLKARVSKAPTGRFDGRSPQVCLPADS
jgi:hypothetical protein